MGAGYRAVGWNRQKKLYDGTMLAVVGVYLASFVGIGFAVHPDATFETMLIRAFGTAAFLLLSVVLSIGPLARLDRRFLPLLYNRRHMGVLTFGIALLHGSLALFQFHALGNLNPLVSVLVANPRYGSFAQFPFQPLGLAALAILFLMAATSHDFWLANLTAPVWKSLHMLVYFAFALVAMHIALGILQAETNPAYAWLVGLGLTGVLGLHVVAGLRESALDEELPAEDEWVDVCALSEIPERRAVVATVAGDRVAVFRYDGKVSALSNACQHQNGPLGEGRVIDGFVTCPWHGYQYLPACGRSPEPFTERVPTFAVKLERGRVLVNARPFAAGTDVAPALIPEAIGG